MTPAEIERFEQKFGVSLPAVWTQCLLEYPGELQKLVRPDETVVCEFEFCNDFELLSQFNEEVRLEPIVDGHDMAFEWPDSFVVIGENGVGDYYLIDVNDPEGHVLFFDHYECEVLDIQETLTSFVEFLVEQYGENSQLEDTTE